MSIITSKKINMLLINLQELDNIKIIECFLKCLTLTWWWWWCKEVEWDQWDQWDLWDLWVCNLEEWDQWEVKEEDLNTTKENIIEIIIKIEDNSKIEDKHNRHNKNLFNKLLLLPLFKQWPFKDLKMSLVNSQKWKKKNKVLFWENFFIQWLKKLLKTKIFPLKLQEC